MAWLCHVKTACGNEFFITGGLRRAQTRLCYIFANKVDLFQNLPKHPVGMLLSVENGIKESWHPVGMPLFAPKDASLRDAGIGGNRFLPRAASPWDAMGWSFGTGLVYNSHFNFLFSCFLHLIQKHTCATLFRKLYTLFAKM